MTEVAFRKLLAVCCDQRVLVFPEEPKINKSPLESSISDLEEGLQGFFCYRLLREIFHFFTLPHHIDKIRNRKHNFLFKSHVVYSCKFVPQVQIKFHYVCSLSLQNWKVNFFPFSTIPQNIIVPFLWKNGNIAICFKFPSKYEFVRCKLFWSNLNQSSPCRKDCLKHSEHAHHKYQEEEFQKRNIKILLHTSMLSKPVISMLEWHMYMLCFFGAENLSSF